MADVWPILIAAAALAAYLCWSAVEWVRLELAVCRRAKLAAWQRRALMDGDRRGFDIGV